MARKSKYAVQERENQQKIGTQKVWRAGVYRRLSVQDGDDEESNSIGNQKKIIDAYIKKLGGIRIVKYYADHGYSGMHYKRPGFMEMMQDVESGLIDAIFVKDISRLGRHYMMTSELVEKLLPMKNIRLVSVNDQYDSEEPNADLTSLLLPIKMIMNDNYARDFSKKIRSSIQSKMEHGEYLPASGSVPYGYLRNQEKRTYDVDVETAPVVEAIFKMRAEGKPYHAIAKKLNAENIPSPGKLRYIRGYSKNPQFENANWVRGTVRKITEDAVYTGCRIHGKVKRDRLEQKKAKMDRCDWNIIPNTHEAIVSTALFDQVQAVRQLEMEKRNRFVSREKVKQEERILLQGKVFCGNCGAKMTARKGLGGKQHDQAFLFFDCNQYHDSGKVRCFSHYVRQEKLMQMLTDWIKVQIELFSDSGMEEQPLQESVEQEKNLENSQIQIARLQARKRHIEAKKEKALIDYIEGILEEIEFLLIKEKIKQEIQQISEKIKELELQKQEIEDRMKQIGKCIEGCKRFQENSMIDRQLVDLLLDRILIFDHDEIQLQMAYQNPVKSKCIAEKDKA